MKVFLLVIALAVGGSSLLATMQLPAQPESLSQTVDGLWESKTKATQTISLEATVDASPEAVYQLWTTPEGVKKFLAPVAHIDPMVGGRYEVGFDPVHDPDAKSYGTFGCKILKLEPGRLAAFEWSFPLIGAALNHPPFPTWVEVRFAPIAGQPDKTLVHLDHLGWPHGNEWDRTFALFRERNWPLVLRRLQTYLHDHRSPW